MSRRATRNSENEGSNSFKEETSKWNAVADMIGGTLEDVYNMDGTERNALLSLLPSEAEIKENNKQFVDLKPLLREDDNSDVAKLTSSSSRGRGTDDSASPQHSPSVVNQKLNKFLEVVVYGAGVNKIQDLDEIERVNKMAANTHDKDKMEKSLINNEFNELGGLEMNDVSFMDQTPNTQKKSSDEKEMYKKANIDEFSMESKEMLTDDDGLEMADESKPWQAYSVVNKNYDSIIESISKFQHVDVYKNVISKVPSSTDCFKMIEESPENYKFDINKAYDTNMTKSSIDASLKGIFKLLSGVKHIKSQTVASEGEELQLVTVYPDSSVKNGFQCLMPSSSSKIKGMSDEKASISPVTESWCKMGLSALGTVVGVDSLGRTRASTSQATSHLDHYDYQDKVYNIDQYNANGDDDDDDYVDLNKKYEKPGRKANGKGKKSKGRVKGKRKSSEDDGITKEKSTGRGRAASKEVDINDFETEPFIAESPAAPSSPVTSILAYKTGQHQTSVDEFEALTSLAAGTSSSSGESTPAEEFEICPTCQRMFEVSQVERHLTQCKGDVRQVEQIEDDEKDFCNVCAQMVSLSSFEDHQKVCSGECSLHQRILKKMKY